MIAFRWHSIGFLEVTTVGRVRGETTFQRLSFSNTLLIRKERGRLGRQQHPSARETGNTNTTRISFIFIPPLLFFSIVYLCEPYERVPIGSSVHTRPKGDTHYF